MPNMYRINSRDNCVKLLNGNIPHKRTFDVRNHEDEHSVSYDIISEAAQYVMERIPEKPIMGIICGTGVGVIAEVIENKIVFPYDQIPNFPISTVKGHHGQLVFGFLHDKPVIAMQGRFHYYEGYSLWKCSMPVRVMKLLGIKHLIVTNAAGALNPKYKVGDIMLINDHFSIQMMSGLNPLRGPNDDAFGERFPSMVNAYDREIIKTARNVAKQLNIESIIQEGVYTTGGGPSYESCAEIRVLRALGGDATGMSTIPEVVVARHCGIKVFAFSLITNVCTPVNDVGAEPNHEEVLEMGKTREPILKMFVAEMVKHITSESKQLEINGKAEP